ncbi:MAG: hypothetical protein P4M12_06615 [Gammaproteobacteria bacterium]|nr:hypothetical protein [Gammaproteobacteria bacterium]
MRYFKLATLLSVCLITNAYATHCPLPSELKHVPGQDWTLNTNQAWSISSTAPARHSSLKTMPVDAKLYVQLYPQNKIDNRAGCMYQVSGDDMWGVRVSNNSAFDPATIPTPPFKKNSPEPLGFRCDTLASNAASCHWG